MRTRLRIFHAERERSVPVLTIELNPTGRAVLTRATDDPAAAAFVESLIGDGVDTAVADPADPTHLEPVRVMPADGAAYLDAVEDMLGRTSRWIVVPD
jgi:hypothetical protein